VSKALARYTKTEQIEAVKRRLASQTKGNGYNAAVDAARHLNIRIEQPKPKAPMSQIEREERNERKRKRVATNGFKLLAGLL
jgi:uncharacterized Zn finger protein